MPKILIDSNLYIHFLRTGAYSESIKALYTFRIRDICFSSVVAEELFQGALDIHGKRNVETLLKPFEKVNRIITPTHEDWKEAGLLISKIRTKRRDLSAHLNRLTHDMLIALSARRIGAIVYTANQKDFELISKFKAFHFEVIQS